MKNFSLSFLLTLPKSFSDSGSHSFTNLLKAGYFGNLKWRDPNSGKVSIGPSQDEKVVSPAKKARSEERSDYSERKPIQFEVFDRFLTPEQLELEILREIKSAIDLEWGQHARLDSVVLTVPGNSSFFLQLISSSFCF